MNPTFLAAAALCAFALPGLSQTKAEPRTEAAATPAAATETLFRIDTAGLSG